MYNSKIIKEELEILSLLKELNNSLNEGFSSSEFGTGVRMSSGSLIIPASNSSILSPVDGELTTVPAITCSNQRTIKFQYNGDTFYLKYCGITTPSVGTSGTIKKKSKIGETKNDVNVYLVNRFGYGLAFSDLDKKKPTTQATPTSSYTTDASGLIRYNDERGFKNWSSSINKKAADVFSGVTYDDRYKKWGARKGGSSTNFF